MHSHNDAGKPARSTLGRNLILTGLTAAMLVAASASGASAAKRVQVCYDHPVYDKVCEWVVVK